MCYFCGQSFGNASELEEHIVNHFNRKRCHGCNNNLISIVGKWYQLHIDGNCNAIKLEPDIDCVRNDQHSDATTKLPDEQKRGKRKTALSEFDEYDSFDAPDMDEKRQRKSNSNVSGRSHELSSKPYPCSFCPATFAFTANRSRHYDVFHKKEITTMVQRKQIAEQQNATIYDQTPSTSTKTLGEKYPFTELQATPDDLKTPSLLNANENAARPPAQASKPFKCKFCSASYNHYSSSYSHMVTLHKKEMNDLRLRKINKYMGLEPEKHYEKLDSAMGNKLEQCNASITKAHTTYNVDKWSCGCCSKSFNWKQNAHKHLRIVHGSDDESMVTLVTLEETASLWYCSVCYLTSKNKLSIDKHARLIHRTRDKTFLKPMQDWRDPDQIQLSGGREEACDYCAMHFGDKSELYQHKRAQHEKELDDFGVIKCSRCPALFNEINLHKIHSIRLHGVLEKRYLNKLDCLVCGESFAKSDKLVAHLRTHAAMESYVCSVKSCDEHFDTIERLKSHLTSHPTSTENRRRCPKCSRYYNESSFAGHHCVENIFCCEQCGKQFKHRGMLTEHLNRHTGNRRHQCKYCPQAFFSVFGRLKHERIHTGERPCKCSVPNCGRAFSQHIDLYRHQYKAHGIFRKKFPCTLCDKVFPENSLLRKHLACHD